MFQIELIHGPTATTTWSQAIVPVSVSTARTAPEPPSLRNPVTATPVTMSTPSARALRSSPASDALLFA